MNRRELLASPIRVAILSLIGLAQFMLVMFGCVYICDHFRDAYPFVRHLRGAAPLIGFLTLIYPVYILMAMRLPEQRQRRAWLTVDCPVCGTRTNSPRMPKNWRQFMWGGWTCRKCGCEIDAQGKQINEETEPEN